MEQRSSGNELKSSSSGVKNFENQTEKNSVGEVGSEHGLNLEGLQFRDQTHRKLKVCFFSPS